ncbi:LysR substrate-binding domain-containing protein [Hoeflea olei]|uniref:Transcriptional regulator n=1 Tax=Hoeflea olei TaxID=1480615 RepID=A0A1C1YTE1_9HYPH|nr:LysR substrate-binding domain-containing protein [Hoeflea olei]OCW56793.1 transcriptional regulator [Hoeflea olei]
MKRGRLPLTALRSFEAAGRLESVTRAAEELFVSQAAVSRQIRELECSLGCALFVRHHRGVSLTREGAALIEVLTGAFDAISDGLAAAAERAGEGEVAVSVEPSFAAGWLVTALSGFRAGHPGIDVNVDSTARLAGFRAGDAELAIRFSAHRSRWPRTQSRWLYDVEMVPLAAPSLFEAEGLPSRPEDLDRHALLHEDSRAIWEQWFAEAGVAPTTVRRGPVYADGGLVRQAALDGQGIGLLERRMVEADLRAGRLVQVFDRPIRYGAYFLVARDFARLSPPAARFADWIGESFGSGAGKDTAGA